MTPRFTILLPITRAPVYLPLALESVRAQTVQEFEVLIVCDGAPEETVDYARAQKRVDSRVRPYSFPKGERFGEAHWHTALAEARGQYVVHLEDDDLWIPNHLEEMEALLSSVDFGHTLHTMLHADGRVETMLSDISDPQFRERFLAEKFNRIGYSVCGYRLDGYRRLSQGWGPAPQDVWTDLHMWRRFFRTAGLTFGTRMSITALVMADHLRQHSAMEERVKANWDAWRRVLDPVERTKIIQAAWTSVVGTGLADENASRAAQIELVNARKAIHQAADAEAAHKQALDTARRALDETRETVRVAKEAQRALQRELTDAGASLRAAISAGEAHEQALNVTRGELLQVQKALREADAAQTALRRELNAIHQSRSWRLVQSLARPFARIRGRWARPSK